MYMGPEKTVDRSTVCWCYLQTIIVIYRGQHYAFLSLCGTYLNIFVMLHISCKLMIFQIPQIIPLTYLSHWFIRAQYVNIVLFKRFSPVLLSLLRIRTCKYWFCEKGQMRMKWCKMSSDKCGQIADCKRLSNRTIMLGQHRCHGGKYSTEMKSFNFSNTQ